MIHGDQILHMMESQGSPICAISTISPLLAKKKKRKEGLHFILRWHSYIILILVFDISVASSEMADLRQVWLLSDGSSAH